MTKEQFLKTYGQPNTVVLLNNSDIRNDFINKCDMFGLKFSSKCGRNIGLLCLIDKETVYRIEWTKTECIVAYKIELTLSPKSLIKDGWMGIREDGSKIWFIVSKNIFIPDSCSVWSMDGYDDDLIKYGDTQQLSVKELYDNLGNLQWKREEKSAKDIEIERIQAEMTKLADDLSKLKGEQ